MIFRCCLGALLVLMDHVFDSLLAYQYYRATDYYAELSKKAGVYGYDFDIWASLKWPIYMKSNEWQYILKNYPDELRDHAPLTYVTFYFFCATVGAVILGGILQAIILIYLRFRRK